jgi:Domain of unknown function (DUF4907)
MHLTKYRSITAYLLCACIISVAAFVAGCRDKSVQTIPAENGDMLEVIDSTYPSGTGWGYKIYVGGNIYINQPFIPGIPGKHYFLTSDDAKKVSTLVVQKMMQHHFPPDISGTELRQLHIIQ